MVIAMPHVTTKRETTTIEIELITVLSEVLISMDALVVIIVTQRLKIFQQRHHIVCTIRYFLIVLMHGIMKR